MAEPYMSQIILLPFNWAPVQYSCCDGTLLDPNQNPALYSLIGNTYGGSGSTSFALPDLRGRAVLHDGGDTFQLGNAYGFETISLSIDEIPSHTHNVIATDEPGNKYIATDSILATPLKSDGSYSMLYSEPPSPSSTGEIVKMNTGTCSTVGSSSPHTNMQPSIVMNFCIAVAGTYPPRN